MATAFNINVDKIVFTSPNMPSPSPIGTRSHIIPGTMDLGTWYEANGSMYRVAINQDIYDTSYSQGIDRPVFGYSGIVASGTTFYEDMTNYIYVYTEQDWPSTTPFNLYLDDNSWFEITDISTYNTATPPPAAPALLPTSFTSSGTLTTTPNIIINGCVCSNSSLTYIFNTEELYSFNTSTETYVHLSTSPYTIGYPVTMSIYSNKLYIFYISNDLLRCATYDIPSDHWSMNAYTTLQQNATSSSELSSYVIGSDIYVTPKYDESSIPSYIYVYIYTPTSNSWATEHVDTCGEYNLNISNSMLSSDSTYLYILERYSRLLHKINLTSKNDTQLITNTVTDSNTSMIISSNKIYIYIPSANVFESIRTTDGQTQNLNVPTLKTEDTSDIEGTILSTDGTYLYLSVNKGVQWVNNTWLYQYDIGANSWSYLAVPSAGGVPFSGNLCNYGATIYGIDQEKLYTYNDTVEGWDILSNLPRSDAEDSIICCDGTYIYVVINQCGYFWKYHITNDAWTVLQTASLPAPTAYEGTKPGHMIVDGNFIYMGLYYNYVTATRDTFYYKYSIIDDVWSTYVAPKTVINRSLFMTLYTDSGDLMIGGCIQYVNSPVDTYRYTIYRRTDAVNNTWSTEGTADINDIPNSKFFCMYGQLLLNGIMYINFTTADNLGFSCQGPVCRKIDTSSNTCSYWMPNPITTMYMSTTNTTDVYYIGLSDNIFYDYKISSATTTLKSIPRKSYVNYFICMRGSIKYLFGKQEIEYNPALYKYTFTVYKQSGAGWAIVNTYSESSASVDDLKLNPIQNYCFVSDTVYMVSYIKVANDILKTSNKKYKITSNTYDDFNISSNTTYTTYIGSNKLATANLNSIVNYDLTTENTELFIEGISGNRSSSFICFYEHGGNVRGIGGQFFTPADGAKYVTYEKTSSWNRIKTTTIPSTFFNTLDYAQYGDKIYCLNTVNHTEYDTANDTISYVSNYPHNVYMCCSGISDTVNIFSDHYACYTYTYDGNNFTKKAGDVLRTDYASNTVLSSSGTLCFIKNSVTNEINYIDINTNIGSTITTDTIFGDTPHLLTDGSDLMALLPTYGSLTTISGTYVTTDATGLDIDVGCSATIVSGTIYYTKGEYNFGFYKIDLASYNKIQLKQLPDQHSRFASIGYIDNKIVYITNNKLYMYDIPGDTWSFTRTLPDTISWKGMYIDTTFIYYCGSSYIYKIKITEPELENSYLGVVPVGYSGNFLRQGSNFILHYNDALLDTKCSYTYTDDSLTLLDVTNVTQYPPTSVPYNLVLQDDTEKQVKISWEIASTINITHYRVYRRDNNSTTKLYVGKTSDLNFIDTSADRGKTFYYSVRSCNEYGCTTNTSDELLVKVNGSEYKYAFKTIVWENRTKEIADLENSRAYRWGNSNLYFSNTVKLNVTFGEAYDCYITAWDDISHSTTNNILLQHSCYRISACAFASESDTAIEEPDYKAMYYEPKFNIILKGNTSYYGKFNINYEPLSSRYGGYIVFKPILINLPVSELVKGKYEFITSLHYKYT